MVVHQRPAGAVTRRRILQLSSSLAVGALAACGGNNGRSSSGSAGGKPTLSQWYHQYGEAGTQQAAQRYAKAYPNANVSTQWVPGDFDAKISSGLLSSDGPDVFEWHFNYQLAKSGQVVPLDDILADAKKDFSAVDLAANSFGGKVYGIRMIDDPQLFFYRKSLLAKAGLQPPTTIDELITATQALTTKDVKGLFLGNDSGIDWAANQVLPATGQAFLTADHKVGFDPAVTTDALLKIQKLVGTGGLLTGAPQDWWDPSAFVQGLCAVTRNGLWALPTIQKALGDDFGVFPTPAFGSAGKQAVYLGGWSTFVSARAKNVDAAKQFVKWLWIDNTADQQDWSLRYGFHIPPRQSLSAQATALQSGPAADVVKLTEKFGWGDDPAWTQSMKKSFEDMTSNIVLKKANPTTELAKAVAAVQTELTKLFG